MTKNRLEAFSDGVIAIIITIMVMQLKAPEGTTLEALFSLTSVFLSYVLSFIYIAIYWNNHHHLLHAANHINGKIMWANTHLLFWLSLVPFATDWVNENHLAPIPVAFYGIVLFMAGLAYFILARCLVAHHTDSSPIVRAIRHDVKGIVSVILYAMAVAIALVAPLVSVALYVLVAILWVIPDRRIEKALAAARD